MQAASRPPGELAQLTRGKVVHYNSQLSNDPQQRAERLKFLHGASFSYGLWLARIGGNLEFRKRRKMEEAGAGAGAEKGGREKAESRR